VATNVLLTIDVELMWRADVARHGWQAIFERSYDPAGVGIPYQLRKLAEHDLHACFFVDPMPGLHFGVEPVKRMVGPILEAGQDVQLHLHPQWAGMADETFVDAFEMNAYSKAEQRAMMERACELLMKAGAPAPIAFRAGSYSANDATLRAAASLGIRYDSSHDGSAHPWPSAISLPADQILPIEHEGVVELPVTLIGAISGYRHLQICAVSLAEMRAALRHAVDDDHPLVTIVSHSFELATRNGERVNRAHLRRFEGLCAHLQQHSADMPTRRVADLGRLPIGHLAEPMPSDPIRALGRQAEQLWSNFYEER